MYRNSSYIHQICTISDSRICG